jgi:hypothetical protein
MELRALVARAWFFCFFGIRNRVGNDPGILPEGSWYTERRARARGSASETAVCPIGEHVSGHPAPHTLVTAPLHLIRLVL